MAHRHSAATTHGLSKTPEFHVWTAMKNRCSNPVNKGFKNYGGRGIRVCQRWRDNFAAFYADMGPRPSVQHSIDRIDNDGPYSPDNCRWATHAQQCANQRRTDLITYKGETLPLNIWAKRYGLLQSTLRQRIVELGWSTEEALTKPTNLYHHR